MYTKIEKGARVDNRTSQEKHSVVFALKDELSKKQEEFVTNYLATLNASESCKLMGYSDKTAPDAGRFYIGTPKVRSAIKQRNPDLFPEMDQVASKDDCCLVLSRILMAEQESTKDRIQAIKILSELTGYQAPKVSFSQTSTTDGPGSMVHFIKEITGQITPTEKPVFQIEPAPEKPVVSSEVESNPI